MHYSKLTILVIILLHSMAASAAEYPILDKAQSSWIGQQIFANECNRQLNCLTSWNNGEDFPSMGIGHFIWYRVDQQEAYQESFPALLKYLESQSIELPNWIVENSYASPWKSQEEFLNNFDEPQLVELRFLLQSHMPEQVDFIIQRFTEALDKIIASSPAVEHESIKDRFHEVANSSPPYGLYTLIDYVNFKGEGIEPRERYNGEGWGLKQVLRNMSVTADLNSDPLSLFVLSAQQVLRNRVTNAPPERNEQRWLSGWENRLNTYLPVINR